MEYSLLHSYFPRECRALIYWTKPFSTHTHLYIDHALPCHQSCDTASSDHHCIWISEIESWPRSTKESACNQDKKKSFCSYAFSLMMTRWIILEALRLQYAEHNSEGGRTWDDVSRVYLAIDIPNTAALAADREHHTRLHITTTADMWILDWYALSTCLRHVG